MNASTEETPQVREAWAPKLRIRSAFLLLLGLLIAINIGAVMVALDYSDADREALRGPIMLYAFLATLGTGLALGLVWRLVDRGLLKASRSLARDIRTLLQAKRIDRALRVPARHHLNDLPLAIDELILALRSSRREAVRAIATATARVEQEKSWLEVILLELIREAVLVLSADCRVLLYNHPASRLLRHNHALGLGRSLFDLVAEAPVQHAIERISLRRDNGYADLSAAFVCATRDNRSMLRARMAMMLDENREASGFVLTLEDISAELEDLSRRAVIRRIVTRDMRGGLASLRAAAETLVAYPDIKADSRRAFEQVLLNESTTLSKRLEDLESRFDESQASDWPMSEIHTTDLFGCLARLLQDQHQLRLKIDGEAQWLQGDSHGLMHLLCHLIVRIAHRDQVRDFAVRAREEEDRTFIEILWPGKPVNSSLIDDWLDQSMDDLPVVSSAREILERHASEAWSSSDEPGQAMLRLPFHNPGEADLDDEIDTAGPRPEFYDFDLMNSGEVSEELGNRTLRDMTFIVFDSETTGLKPAGGDEIISLAAVRLTKGRVLSGETFEALVNPGRSIPRDSIRFHGITDDMVADAPPITEVLPRFHMFAGDAVLVAHNAAFDMKFIKLKEAACGVKFDNPVLDTMLISLLIEGDEEDHSLDAICDRLEITVENRHSAYGDAIATAEVLAHFLDRLEARGIHTFKQVMEASNMEAALRFRAGHF